MSDETKLDASSYDCLAINQRTTGSDITDDVGFGDKTLVELGSLPTKSKGERIISAFDIPDSVVDKMVRERSSIWVIVGTLYFTYPIV